VIASAPSLLILWLVAQSPAADSLIRLAQRLPESGLAVEARARPLAVREAVVEALERAVRAPGNQEQAMKSARRLAGAYAAAWRDSFLLRQVDRFAGLVPRDRITKVRGDSLRRAGVAVFSRDGPAAAVAVWRRAWLTYRVIADSAGMAGTLDNIGAGMTQLGRLDTAAAYLTRARRIATAIGDARVMANVIGHLGDLAAERGGLATARERYAEARALRERIGDVRGVAADHNNLGLLAQDMGDVEEARRQFEAALALNRRDGREELVATNLVNLAGLAGLVGDLATASTLYRDALATWRVRNEPADAAVALHGLGQLELRRGDYPAARAALLEALEIYERTGPPAAAVRVRGALADALAAAGDLQGAVDQLQRAQQSAESAGVDVGARAALALGRGDLSFRLNALPEAEARYREAERLYRQARDSQGEAEARHGLGLLAVTRGNTAHAEALFTAALRSQTLTGSHRAAALTRLSLARVAWTRGDTVRGRREMAQAAADLVRLGDAVGSAEALGERGALEARAGFAPEAESYYRAALRRIDGRETPETTWRLRAGLGLALKAQGSVDAAARELGAAVDALDGPSRSLALPERRSAFLADKWDTYAQLALLQRARGLPAAAFEANERLRAREMLELLSRGRITASAGGAPDLVGREQDLRHRIAELMRELDNPESGADVVRGPDLFLAGKPTRDALLRAQEEYADLLLRIRERAPRHAAFVAPRTVTWQAVAERLRPDQVFVTYLLSDSGSVAFVVVRDTMVTVDLGASRRELARLVEFARGTLELRSPDAPWRGVFRRLHDHLIAPVEDTHLLAGKTDLVLAPHAELHYLPFAALLPSEAGGRFLAARFRLTVTPSASVWLALGDRPSNRTSDGVLAFAPRPDALPASSREVAAVERLSRDKVQVRIGPTATEAMFRREAPGRRILHLATYGVLNKHNPLFSFLELRPGGTDDGRLEVHEVFGLQLAADLVILSACQTGLGSGALADVPPGDDWVSLTRAFLHAGASQVVATLWPVDDWATAALMEQFYRAMAQGAGPVLALAEAQRALAAEAATSHPYFWAGFVIVGGAEPASREQSGVERGPRWRP
jgi:CHAT domain-containing protein/Tfp pilus assembly protein PilF